VLGEAPKGYGMGGGYPPCPLEGLGSVVSVSAGSGAEPWPETNFAHHRMPVVVIFLKSISNGSYAHEAVFPPCLLPQPN